MDTNEMAQYISDKNKSKIDELECLCDLVRQFIKVEEKESTADLQFKEALKGFTLDTKRAAKILMDKDDALVQALKDKAYGIVDSYVDHLIQGRG